MLFCVCRLRNLANILAPSGGDGVEGLTGDVVGSFAGLALADVGAGLALTDIGAAAATGVEGDT